MIVSIDRNTLFVKKYSYKFDTLIWERINHDKGQYIYIYID